ncbi:MAG: hypothetical protein WC656_03675 [Sulfurimonas sp.]|jgi:hypothetical protein
MTNKQKLEKLDTLENKKKCIEDMIKERYNGNEEQYTLLNAINTLMDLATELSKGGK